MSSGLVSSLPFRTLEWPERYGNCCPTDERTGKPDISIRGGFVLCHPLQGGTEDTDRSRERSRFIRLPAPLPAVGLSDLRSDAEGKCLRAVALHSKPEN